MIKNIALMFFTAGLVAIVGIMATGAGGKPGASNTAAQSYKPFIDKDNLRDIYFAGGCFWGVEEYFSRVPGVYDVTSGYANGTAQNPTYKAVCSGTTGYAEAVHIQYDPKIISLKTLAEQLFTIINPLSVNRQGNDVGSQYRTGMYYVADEDRSVLEAVMQAEQQKYDKPLAVELEPLQNYYLAEDYHQDYLQKNPNGYCHISFDSLDDVQVEYQGTVDPENYAKPDREDLQKTLSLQEFDVTQKGATERAFSGAYLHNKEPGIYVDITTGEPLFLSSDKYDSGSGWPSFTKPVDPTVVTQQPDSSRGMQRTEVQSRVGGAHLGHVFNDGPDEDGGLRYCINSAALRFIPYDEMEAQGYGEFKALIE